MVVRKSISFKGCVKSLLFFDLNKNPNLKTRNDDQDKISCLDETLHVRTCKDLKDKPWQILVQQRNYQLIVIVLEKPNSFCLFVLTVDLVSVVAYKLNWKFIFAESSRIYLLLLYKQTLYIYTFVSLVYFKNGSKDFDETNTINEIWGWESDLARFGPRQNSS